MGEKRLLKNKFLTRFENTVLGYKKG